jgi:hypothetical protein
MPTTTIGRGPRYGKSPVGFGGQSAIVCRAGFSETTAGAKKALQRLQEKLTELATMATVHPELKGRLRRLVAPVLQVLERGTPLPFSADLVIDAGQSDLAEDAKKLLVVADDECPKTVAEWLAAARRAHDDQAEAIASAEAWLAGHRLMGGVQ